MFTTEYFNLISAALIAAEPTLLGGAATISLRLVGQPFTPSGDSDPTNYPPPVFPGYASIPCATTGTKVIENPETGEVGFLLAEPIGGFNFKSNAAPTNPVSVYGYALIDSTDNKVLGSANFPQGVITVSVAEQVIEVSAIFGWLAEPLVK